MDRRLLWPELKRQIDDWRIAVLKELAEDDARQTEREKNLADEDWGKF